MSLPVVLIILIILWGVISLVIHNLIHKKSMVTSIGGGFIATLLLMTFAIGVWSIFKADDQELNSQKEPISESPNLETETVSQSYEQRAISILNSAKSLTDVIELVKPHMEDGVNQMPEGATAIPLWAQSNDFSWSALNEIPTTTYGKIMKDSESERGKRLCVTGTVIEIAVDRSAGLTTYNAGMMSDSFKVTRLLAIESTGDIVAQSNARFCGITIGTMSYTNAAGGTTSAPYLVGMFDLPENK